MGKNIDTLETMKFTLRSGENDPVELLGVTIQNRITPG